MHEGKGKAYDKREKGKAGEVKGKRERPQTRNLIRDPTRQPDRAHARTTRNDFPIRGSLPKGELTPPNLRFEALCQTYYIRTIMLDVLYYVLCYTYCTEHIVLDAL